MWVPNYRLLLLPYEQLMPFSGWNMRIQARETNYGTRVDYILVTKGLLPWISYGDIQPALKGSDHCPIYIDLRDEITLDSGETITLRDAMRQTPNLKDPPRIAAKYWEEFSAKQTVLSAFFGKGAAAKKSGDVALSASPTPTPATQGSATSEAAAPSAPSQGTCSDRDRTPPAEPPPKKLKPVQPAPVSKRRPSENPTSSKKRKGAAPVKGQASIAAFFSKPSSSTAPASSSSRQTHEVIDVDGEDDANHSLSAPSSQPQPESLTESDQLDADYRLALAQIGRAHV